MYRSECWCLRKDDERTIVVAEMSWLRRILGRSRIDQIRNEVTRKELGQEITLIDKIRKRRLTWHWHVRCSLWRKIDYRQKRYMDKWRVQEVVEDNQRRG